MPIELQQVLIGLGIIAISIILSLVIGYLLKFVSVRFSRRTLTRLDDVLLASVTGPLRVAIIVAGLQIALNQIDAIQEEWRKPIGDFFFVVYLLIIYVALYRLTTGLAEWYGQEVTSRTETELDEKFLSFFRALANIIISIIAFIILLGHFGIEPSALVATLGIGSLAIALAAQETLSDIISGFMILLDQPFAIGDRVALLDIDTWGDVTEIGLRSTRILTRDNRMVTVPNSVIGKGLIVNYSDPSTLFRVETHIGLAYGIDVETARAVLVGALEEEEWVMREKPVEALMLSISDSALVFRVRCWIENYIETRRVIDKMNTALYRALNQAQIELAMPQREVFLQGATVTGVEEPGAAEH
ncbi:MAG: mechanosensitive ion channel family protein [Chloroflexota bacterium]|nr:MAG: mechanosensitive ion channel family protein [Chloroflexota bacterium]